eukprot:TRINITY_DN11603_c0_g1_i1.p1 TRINITY_DN11603_c0_g1~~TRINITY_DN11603_c0_g1_i1.p1  ORF type:complete len:376 (+),score=142.59 TRINITY_DN11603_c0_g1_i1:89-1129(+)
MAAAGAGDAAVSVPWVEKYRPRTVSDVVHQEEVCAMMNQVLENKIPNMPHLLFYGPPGTGKTSTILAVCHQLYGPEYYKTRVKELNASDERGIEVIRRKVKTFAKGAIGTVPGSVVGGKRYPVPPYKIIILDEADAMTADAQACLRRVIEEFSSVTRFCLICNYVSRIIDPLVSRCVKFRFKPITRDSFRNKVRSIAEKEGLTIAESGLAALDQVSSGDLRLALQYLQGAYRAHGTDLTKADWDDLAGRAPERQLRRFYNSWWGDFATMQRAAQATVDDGYSAYQFVSQLVPLVIEEDAARLPDAAKANILVKCAGLTKPLYDGADELLQLLDLGGHCIAVISKKL